MSIIKLSNFSKWFWKNLFKICLELDDDYEVIALSYKPNKTPGWPACKDEGGLC